MSSNPNRDIVKELKTYTTRFGNVSMDGFPEWDRMNAIMEIYLAIDQLKSDSPLIPELHRHIIVSLVAVIQSETRTTITQIVDEKELAGDSLPELQSAKLTLEIARELKNQSFSFGELVAHFLSVSSVEQIEKSIKHVSGVGFSSILKGSFGTIELESGHVQLPDAMMKKTRMTFTKLFELRNIYCHEVGDGTVFESKDIYEFIRATISIISALSGFRTEYCDKIRSRKTSE